MDYSLVAKILVYVIFMASGFIGTTLLVIRYQTKDPNAPDWPNAPQWQEDNSLIDSNPILFFLPIPLERKYFDFDFRSALILLNTSDQNSYLPWSLELEEYYNPSGTNNYERVICDYGRPAPPGKVCDVNLSTWGQCTKDNKYGIITSTPCIFLKLDKIFGWEPKFYNDTNNLPASMPMDLKEYIMVQEKLMNSLDTIWVSCAGENPADTENMGPIQYIPRRGFPGYYFPFKNTSGYLSPLVAVFFERPKHGVVINIECKAWAQNIIHDRLEMRGWVHFKLLVD